jgi:galactokinase
MTELEQLTELCMRLGAAPTQAVVMATQLQKRADQMAAERGVTRVAAMHYLLEAVVKGRQGETLPATAPIRPTPSMRENLLTRFHATFGRSPTVITRAPGRTEFIGNHTDYNGGTVLGAAIDRGVWVAVAPRSDGMRQFASEQQAEIVTQRASEIKKLTGDASWTNYPLGVLDALPEFGLQAPAGFDFYAVSDLPSGAGLSSSAALELAAALAFLALTGQRSPRETVVKIGRHAENHFVGVPCGILDQGVSGFGKKDHLVYIDCRGPRFDIVPMPGSTQFWIFNTHTKHALVDGLYAARHRECMDAAQALGVGLLVDATPAQVESGRGKLSPEGYKRAKHVVDEIARVDACVAALRTGDLAAIGRLLTASHRSSQRWFENSTSELDFLVDTLCAQPRVLGARLTGGGFGGAVMALTTSEFTAEHAAQVVMAYREKYGPAPDVLHTRTAEGAAVVSADSGVSAVR